MAAAYHASRDLFPHARTRRLRYQRGGEIFFRPDPARWRGARAAAAPERPHGGRRSARRPGRGRAGARPRRAGLDGLPARRLDRGRRSPFRRADLLRRSLPDRAVPREPGRPRVRAGARRRRRRARCDLGAGGVAAPPRPRARRPPRALLRRARRAARGSCSASASARTASRAPAATAPTPGSCAGGPARRSSGRSRASLPQPRCRAVARGGGELLGGQLGALLEARCETVASLAGELAEATAEHGARFELLDSSGAIKGYADGRPEGDSAPSIAWRHGIDVAACARAGATIGAIAYAADPARVAAGPRRLREPRTIGV